MKPLYIWSYINTVIPSTSERKFLFDVCNQEGIDTLIADIKWSMGLDWATFMAEANDRGIEVHALISGNSATEDYSDRISFAENNGFAGISWDIEPENITEYTALMESFTTSMFQSCYLNAPFYMNRDSGANYADISNLYSKFDLILINSYADTLSFQITHANDAPLLCAELGIDFMLGIETAEFMIEGGIYTLWDEDLPTYRSLMAEVYNNYKGNPLFKGVYTHHWHPDAFMKWFTEDNMVIHEASSVDFSFEVLVPRHSTVTTVQAFTQTYPVETEVVVEDAICPEHDITG